MKNTRLQKREETAMIIPPKRIVFTGGGLRSLCHFGSLEELEKRGLLQHLKEVLGVSAGAMVGFSYMLGYTIPEMIKTVVEFDFSILQDAHPELVLDFFNTFGIDSGDRMEKFLISLLRIKGYPVDMTFGQWATQYPTRVKLRCFASDLHTCQVKEFSAEKTPTVSFVFALRASMCLPLYFVPLKDPETDHYYVDGGVIQNFPMNVLSDAEKETALGISFLYTQDTVESIPDFVSYLRQIYNCGFNPRTYRVQQDNSLRCILIPTGSLSAYNFDLTKEDRLALIDQGRIATQRFCETYLNFLRQQTKPVRRYSAS